MSADRWVEALRAWGQSPAGQRLWARVGGDVLAAADVRVREALAERRAAWLPALAEVEALRGRVRTLDRAVEAAAPRYDRTPIGPGLTVHAAHARDPRVQAVFARHGLPDCPSCAVGADETLAEAALAEGFSVDALLAELRTLGVD